MKNNNNEKLKEYRQETCIYFSGEEIGGIPELNLIQWAWYCDKTGKMEDEIDCVNCKDYMTEKDLH